MAAEDDAKQQETQKKQEATKTESSDKMSLVGRFLPWIIIAVIVVFFAGAGLTIGRLFAGSGTPQTPGDSEQDQSAQDENLKAKGSAAGTQKTWYYDLEPVIANLNVTDVTRYVRASLTLEVSSEVDEKNLSLIHISEPTRPY